MIFVGVDIGLDGALAALKGTGEILSLSRMPLLKNSHERREVSANALASWFLSLTDDLEDVRVMTEYVHSFGYESRSSMFSFGRSDGKTRAVFEILQTRFADVDPREWKNSILAGTKKDKLAAIRFCEERWGAAITQDYGIKTLTDGIADALCLAEYARQYNWSSC